MELHFNPFDINDKVIMITGASSGIGRQCAISCSEMGAKVILLGRNNERLKETIEMMIEPSRHFKYSIDLVEYNKVEEVINDAVAKFGKFHGLINCAGISITLPFKYMTPEKMDEYFHANVHTSMNLTRLMISQSYISEKGASIIFISSVMGYVGEIGKSLYSMTKGALIAGARSLAIELAPRIIRVNCISPGVVVTPMSKKAIYSKNEESLNKIKALHPLGLGQTRDIANACIYLLSDASKWVTGTNLLVDGGYTAK